MSLTISSGEADAYYSDVKCNTAVLVLVGLAACGQSSAPARLVVGIADTVLINNRVPVRVPMHVLDRAGNELSDSGIRFEWTSGVRVPVSARGVVHCTEAGDATIHASLGALVANALVRCRPVHAVYGGRTLNLLVGDSSLLAFSPVDSAGRPVTLFTMGISYDSAIVSVENWRLHARAPGQTSVDFYIGDEWAHWHVLVYAPAQSLEGMRPGEMRAVPVRVAGGEMKTFSLPLSPPTYSVTMLPQDDTLRAPRLAVLGSNCNGGLTTSLRSYWCFAVNGAAVVAYHPKESGPMEEWSGAIAVRLDECPQRGSSKMTSALCQR